ncbi:MAG: hypothetical protein M1504_01585 [Candidatus Marsarchaeota archaeon]|nr:hypothetical protein [Candidatus Marsarchaeota archaeon]
MIIIAFIFTGFRLPSFLIHNTTSTTTIISNSAANSTSNSISNSTSNTIAANTFSTNCGAYAVVLNKSNETSNGSCNWTGGVLGTWVSSGNYTNETLRIVGDDGKTYVNETETSACTTFFDNFSAPAQTYSVYFHSGLPSFATNSSCPYAMTKLNTTTTPPKVILNYILNGNFGNGEYTGWTTNGVGFGKKPLNITEADANTIDCYLGTPWANYNGTFFATSFRCGLGEATGNLTSQTFYASQPFLNFRVISNGNNDLSVQILYNGTPYIITHYNTYNSTLYTNSSATFRNASIPLVTVVGKPIQIMIHAGTLNSKTFIAAGDFRLSSTPLQDKGIQFGPYNFTGSGG